METWRAYWKAPQEGQTSQRDTKSDLKNTDTNTSFIANTAQIQIQKATQLTVVVDSSGQMTRLIVANGCNYGDTRIINSFPALQQ